MTVQPPPRSETVRTRTRSADDRGQAYTLEGFVGAAIVLVAVLLAFQSVALSADVADTGERNRQLHLQQEAHDALVVAANAEEPAGDLSAFVRAWDGNLFSSGGMENFVLGEILTERFGESPHEYRITFTYENEGGTVDRETVYRSTEESPDTDVVAASYPVTIFEDEATNETDPIPSRDQEMGSASIVVDVGVTVW